jgi:hypothetical protein
MFQNWGVGRVHTNFGGPGHFLIQGPGQISILYVEKIYFPTGAQAGGMCVSILDVGRASVF